MTPVCNKTDGHFLLTIHICYDKIKYCVKEVKNLQYKRLKMACYSVGLSMSVVGNMPPILFLTFRKLYGLSYTVLGLFIVINFLTQLAVDFIFSFFSHKFNIEKTVKSIPVITLAGLLIYAFMPMVFPQNAFRWLFIGTVIFSAAAGLGEVLISPVIAAIPSDDPDKEMSKLHSAYAWGVIPVVIISTLFILFLGGEKWHFLVLMFMAVPAISAILFSKAEIPKMETPKRVSGVLKLFKRKTLWLCIIAIFLGGAAECTMAQWASAYIENALAVPKVWGDIFGVTFFALTLGLGRTLYSKYGKDVTRILVWGAAGATVCYFAASVTMNSYIGLIACALTGFCTALMWPGCLVVAADNFKESGVFIYAIMAAGGDLGASVVPQLVGIISDTAMKNQHILSLAQSLSISPEQLGMRAGMLIGTVFPLMAILVYSKLRRAR